MTNDEVASLIQLNMKSIKDGVARGMLKNLTLNGPYESPGAGHFVVHVSLVNTAGALADYVLVSPAEVNQLLGTDANKADAGLLTKLLEQKGDQVGYSMAEVIGRSGARDLEWSRTLGYAEDRAWWYRRLVRTRGLWRRLRWAWTGIIPIEPWQSSFRSGS